MAKKKVYIAVETDIHRYIRSCRAKLSAKISKVLKKKKSRKDSDQECIPCHYTY